MSNQTHATNAAEPPLSEIDAHALYVIEEKIDEWRNLRRSLAASQGKMSAYLDAFPQAVAAVPQLEADVRLLQCKCDRALDALGAAVAALRSLSWSGQAVHPRRSAESARRPARERARL